MKAFFVVFVSCLFLPSCQPGESGESMSEDSIIRITLKGAECPFADHADYGIFVPRSDKPLRGALVLQHGCGMERSGITRPYDLQYRAFAEKWNLAIVEAALHGDCHQWHDPSSGSAEALFDVLALAADKAERPELTNAPLLLWGHSSGGHWTLGMLRDYPERIIAVVCYSAAWDPQWDYDAEAAKVPVLLRHAGTNDGDAAIRCQETAEHTCAKLRSMGGAACVACNADQNHNFSHIRYMAIPFYEAVLSQRLPAKPSSRLRDLDRRKTWLGDPVTMELFKETGCPGDREKMYRFPDERTARNWKEFVSTGTVVDKTPPPAPYDVKVAVKSGMMEVSWKADADIESGILKFNIYKDGILVGSLPDEGPYQSFDTNGDNTIPIHPPRMSYIVPGTGKARIGVETVNHFNLISKRTTCADY